MVTKLISASLLIVIVIASWSGLISCAKRWNYDPSIPLNHYGLVTPINQLVTDDLKTELLVNNRNLSSNHGLLAKLDSKNKTRLVLYGISNQNKTLKFELDENQEFVQTSPEPFTQLDRPPDPFQVELEMTKPTESPELEGQIIKNKDQVSDTKLIVSLNDKNVHTLTNKRDPNRHQHILSYLKALSRLKRSTKSQEKRDKSNKYKEQYFDPSRTGKDLVYEKMKMRSKASVPLDKHKIKPVGGGILEQHIIQEHQDGDPLEMSGRQHEYSYHSRWKSESREMQCCNDIQLDSNGGVKECHPYALGRYRKIGSCEGKSFYQHVNNTDIFLYHACGAWYIGLEIGACGGWILAKSLEHCASAQHLTSWKFFNEGKIMEDESFRVEELCKLYSDFRPVPQVVPTPSSESSGMFAITSLNLPSHSQQVYPPGSYQSDRDTQDNDKGSIVKHEHYHYHINGQTEKKEKKEGNNKLRRKPTLPSRQDPKLFYQDPDPEPPYKNHIGHRNGLPVQSVPLHHHPDKAFGNNPTYVKSESQRIPIQSQPHILINNFHPVSTPNPARVTPEDRRPPNDLFTPYQIKPNPQSEYLNSLRRPMSDLQFQSKLQTVKDKIDSDLMTSHQYAVMDPPTQSQEASLVGYIIKKKPSTGVGSGYWVKKRRINHESGTQQRMAHQDSQEEKAAEEKIYFPVRLPSNDDDKNSRRLA